MIRGWPSLLPHMSSQIRWRLRVRTLYQHALLSMARMHYSQGDLRACRLVIVQSRAVITLADSQIIPITQFLDEAIKVSREKNDATTLDSCQRRAVSRVSSWIKDLN